MAAKPRRVSGVFAKAEAALREHALAKPEASEHFPWGERAIKVKGKVFLFMRADATGLSLSTKLPRSSGVALLLPFAEPTGYGLGKAGWVTASFEANATPPVEMLCAWVDESYQAVAPAKLAAAARGEAATATAAAKSANPARPRAAKSAKPGRIRAAKSAKPGRIRAAKSAKPVRPRAKAARG